MKTIIATPELRRRAIYLFIGLIGLVGMGAGKFTPDQVDSWGASALQFYDQVSPVISAMALGLAAKKAVPGADDPTTAADLEAATAAARESARAEALKDVGRVVEGAVARATGAVESLLPAYHGPTTR